MVKSIEIISASNVIDITKTVGNSPLQVLARDGNIYYVKTSEAKAEPYTDLICEIICNYFCACWGLKSPNQKLVTMSNEMVNSFLIDNNKILPPIYNGKNFDNFVFYGSEIISNSSELDSYISFFNSKYRYKKFHNPMDFLKIATFDRWIGNVDRRPQNPNIIISQIDKKFHFHPIDHSASFGDNDSLKAIKAIHLHVDGTKTLIKTDLAQSILKYTPKNEKINFSKHIMSCIEKTVGNMKDIFEQVPSDWGFSKKAKENIFSILSDKDRNEAISHSLTC